MTTWHLSMKDLSHIWLPDTFYERYISRYEYMTLRSIIHMVITPSSLRKNPHLKLNHIMFTTINDRRDMWIIMFICWQCSGKTMIWYAKKKGPAVMGWQFMESVLHAPINPIVLFLCHFFLLFFIYIHKILMKTP